MSHLVIVGGSDAGISAALRARELDTSVQVTMIVEDAFPNYSIYGLPFYLSGEVPDYHQLAHRTREEITSAGIDLLFGHTAQAIDPESPIAERSRIELNRHNRSPMIDSFWQQEPDRGVLAFLASICQASSSCIRWKAASRCSTICKLLPLVQRSLSAEATLGWKWRHSRGVVSPSRLLSMGAPSSKPLIRAWAPYYRQSFRDMG